MNNKIKDKIKANYVASDIDEVLDYISILQERLDFMIDSNDEKQERINKGIEYINKTTNNTMFELRSDTGELNYLMRILKGDE